MGGPFYDPRPFDFSDPASLGMTIFLIIFNVVYLFLLIYVVAIIIARRNHRFISPRTPETLVPLQIFCFLLFLYFSLSIIMGKPPFCLGFNIFYALLPFFTLHFNLNIPILVFHSDLNALKISRANGNLDSNLWKIKVFISLPAKIFYSFVACAFQVVLVFCLWRWADLTGDCARPGILAYGLYAAFYIFVLGYFLVRLNRVEDPFFMRHENHLGSLANLGCFICMIIYPFAPSVFPDWFDFRWVPMVAGLAAILVDGLFPVLLTYDKVSSYFELKFSNKEASTEQMQEMETKGTIFALNQGMDIFQAVLSNPILLEAFTQFTVKQWCVENVLFYKAIEKYKAEWEDSKASTERGMMIIREYVVSKAPMEVNLESQERMTIIKKSYEGNLPKDIFDQAKKTIYNLMERDSFSNWKRTKDFKEALERVVTSRSSNSRGTGSGTGH